MKYIKLFLIAFVSVLVFSSCDKDPDNEEPKDPQKEQKTGIEDSHDMTTDQPAYSRQW